MKRNQIIIAAAVALTLAGLLLMKRQSSMERSEKSAQKATAVVSTGTPKQDPQTAATAVEETSAATGTTVAPAPNVEARSLEAMARVLADHARGQRDFNELIATLEKSGQEPLVFGDRNEDTGEMLIVRTKNPWPGTRYFHAQYFTDEQNHRFVQHMSFEFKPGPQAMDQAIAAIRRSFALFTQPQQTGPDFVQWEIGNGAVVWIRKMGKQDLENDYFNAYTSEDTGTVRVAVELDLNHSEH